MLQRSSEGHVGNVGQNLFEDEDDDEYQDDLDKALEPTYADMRPAIPGRLGC